MKLNSYELITVVTLGAMGYLIGVYGQSIFLFYPGNLAPFFGMYVVFPVSLFVGLAVGYGLDKLNASKQKIIIIYICSVVTYSATLFYIIVIDYKPEIRVVQAKITTCKNATHEIEARIDYWRNVVEKQKITGIAKINEQWENEIRNKIKNGTVGVIVELLINKSFWIEHVEWKNGTTWQRYSRKDNTVRSIKAFIETRKNTCAYYLSKQLSIYTLNYVRDTKYPPTVLSTFLQMSVATNSKSNAVIEYLEAQ